jgi:hypothetical protein
MMLILDFLFEVGDRSVRLLFANHDVAIGAVNDCFQLRLFRSGDAELVECLLKIVHERFPFLGRDVQVLMRFTHRASGIFLRAACGPADHFGNQILEACWGHSMMRFVHGRIGVQAGIGHDATDKIIDHGRDAIDPTETFIEGRLICL